MRWSIDKNQIERLYHLGRGVKVRFSGFEKTFYPVKARTCRNCHFAVRNEWYGDDYVKGGCYFFDAKINKNGVLKPLGICVPVKDDSDISEGYADALGTQLVKHFSKVSRPGGEACDTKF